MCSSRTKKIVKKANILEFFRRNKVFSNACGYLKLELESQWVKDKSEYSYCFDL